MFKTRLQRLSHPNRTVTSPDHLFNDCFGPNGELSSVRELEFIGSIYAKMKRTLQTLQLPHNATAEAKTAINYPIGIDPVDMVTYEADNLALSTSWLYLQTLEPRMKEMIITANFPYFLYCLYDMLSKPEHSFEDNEFDYLSYLSVYKPILEGRLTGTTTFEKIKNASTRWWYFYAVHTFRDIVKDIALDFYAKLDIPNARGQISRSTVYAAASEMVQSMIASATNHLNGLLNVGVGNNVVEYVGKFINEITLIRNAHAEAGRVELKMTNNEQSQLFTFHISDRSAWMKHTRRIANSFSHQSYIMNKKGQLEPQLDTRELASMIVENVAFTGAGVDSTVQLSPSLFYALALDPSVYINTSRVAPYFNENGMNLPNNMDSLTYYYNPAVKDEWFSYNSRTSIDGPITAIDLEHKMNMQHLINGAEIKNCGESFSFDSAVTAELALKMFQRFWALVCPETTVTGTLSINYDNAFGMPMINGLAAADEWYSSSLVRGLNITIRNNVSPIITFLDMLNLGDNVIIDRNNNLIIGSELLKVLYNIFRSYGIEELKATILPWFETLDPIDLDRDVYPEWTSTKGQLNAGKRMNGIGKLIKEAQCIKGIFKSATSSSMNAALVKALSIIISYSTTTFLGSTPESIPAIIEVVKP